MQGELILFSHSIWKEQTKLFGRDHWPLTCVVTSGLCICKTLKHINIAMRPGFTGLQMSASLHYCKKEHFTHFHSSLIIQKLNVAIYTLKSEMTLWSIHLSHAHASLNTWSELRHYYLLNWCVDQTKISLQQCPLLIHLFTFFIQFWYIHKLNLHKCEYV